MKVCPKCQFIGNDNEIYCMKCGALLPESVPTAQVTSEAPQAAPVTEAPSAPQTPPTPPYAPYMPAPQQFEDVSVGKWFLYHLIQFIPCVGGLIFLIMLFVWGFGDEKNKTFRNWAKAKLIFYAIGLVFIVLFFVLMVTLGVTLADLFYEMTLY